MKKSPLITTTSLIGALLMAAASPAFAQQPAAAQAQSLSYGTDALQKLDFWRAPGQVPAPLVVFVHGGGWKRGDKDGATGPYKVAHYTGRGYAFASVNYRLVPDATVEQQAQDIADALAALLRQSDRLGIARGRVVLMGHSAGAHLVALVGTDPRYLRKAGLSYADIRGVIPIDGAAYDVPGQMQDAGRMMGATYRQTFGTDAARQRALSPTFQTAAPNAPEFLLLHVQRVDGVRQAEELEAALRKAGTHVEREGFPGRGLPGHMQINRELGNPTYAATGIVDRWLARVLG
ncbi:alpha/beta hydrolase [Novosphingobium guangzhouense]|uniref:Esterase n=1 Tax=Novosphingobium guangzhouense TaxID=1850347 RepID=A0A2K2G656_9SPHN|nr:alpha/beta hydrolase [Novosphingobium guangzhouense]PNU06521.1 esterase [Novosphingobium guangzhouense]